jgi:amino acid transporter
LRFSYQRVVNPHLGYNTVAYMGGEVRNPGRVMPRAIIISIFAIMVIYLAMNIGVLSVLPWPSVARSTSVAHSRSRITGAAQRPTLSPC